VERDPDRLEADHSGDPSAQLRAWLKDMAAHLASGDERGCPLAKPPSNCLKRTIRRGG
jgi:hypothetical protein